MRFALVGCGLIGEKRARTLRGHELVACADVSLERAERLAARIPGCVPTDEPRQAIEHPGVDAVIVATPHAALAPNTLAAIEAGRHVLVEKPAARSAAELRPVVTAARNRDVIVKVGYNHRFHPSFERARRLFDEGAVGELMYIRARYGHGGRPGYEREWRADPVVSGGGELLDQGSHLIDLARWFAGDFAEVNGHVGSYFWPMPVEDNAFLMLKTAAGQVAWLHASWSEWKNLFSFEIFGRTGKLQIDGLGGSYGVERLTFYRMLPEMGPPETMAWEFPGDDGSWQREMDHFVDCVEKRSQPSGSLDDALANLAVVCEIYRMAGRDYHA